MIEWIQTWQRSTWAFAIGAGILVLVALAVVFGADTLKEWVGAVWGGR